jgi:dephospho-CoA kinase
MNGAGKSTVCDFFSGKGFQVLSLSDSLRDYVTRKGLPLDRDTLTNTANDLKAEKGLDVLAKLVFDMADKQDSDSIVFDSIRNSLEIQFLADKGVTFIGVTADLDVRYERVKKRARETDHIDFETFKRQDERERSGESLGQNISAALSECQYFIDNNTDLESLYKNLEALLSEMKLDV